MSQVRWRVQKPKAKQIGFLASNPFPPNQGSHPLPPGSGPNTGPGTGQQAPPPQLGFNDLINHSQRWMGMFNQLSPMINNMAPMLRLLQGFNFGGLPIKYEITIDPNNNISIKWPEKERRTRKKRTKRRATR